MSIERSPGVPETDPDPRDRIAEAREPTEKTWFRNLDEAVIEADRCVQCGSCMAACPSDSIGIDEETGRPTLVRMCTGCSRCWDFCPRSGLRYERLNGLEGSEAQSAYAVSAAGNHEGQNGGAVTALLAGLLEAGEIDGAVVVGDGGDALTGEPILATTRTELLESAGSSYTQTMQLGRVDGLIADSDLEDPDIALVGTPCVIEGAAALNRLQYDDELASVALTISLVCTRSFAYERLRSLLIGHGVGIDSIDSLEIDGGDLIARDDDGARLLTEDVEAFDAAALRGCAECSDAVGEAADISAGNVGSPDGKTTLLARTQAGEAAIDAATADLDPEELDEVAALEGFADWNRRQAEASIPRDLDADAPLSITYTEHHDAYGGTDRAPESLNPARVHQYEEWC